jgi:hypothetical protein
LDDLKPMDDRDDSKSIRSTTRNSANSICSVNTNKALPTLPSNLESSASYRTGASLQSVKSASHMYAEYAHSLRSTRSGNSLPQYSSVRTMRKEFSVRGSTLANAWEDPRAAPVPRKKSSLWERLRKALDE